MDYDVDSTGLTAETNKIQQDIDDIANAGAGLLYFPTGLYKVVTLYIKK